MHSYRSLLGVTMLALSGLAAAQVGAQRWLPQNQVVWNTFQTGIVSKIQGQTVQTMSTENEFQMYWKVATGQPPQTAPRNIDWLKEKIVAVHLGLRPSGGYSVSVTGVDRSGTMAIVHAVEHKPMRGQWVSDNVTAPWVMIKVPRDLGQIKLDLGESNGIQIGGATIYSNGGAIIRPGNYDRVGGGSIDPRNAVNWGTITSGTQSYATTQGVYDCPTPDVWARTWSQLTGARPNMAPTGLDWSKEKVVVVALGERPSTGFNIQVLSVERNGQYGIIRAVEETPLSGSNVRRRPTHPFVVVRVPRELNNFSLDLRQRESDGGTRIIDGG